MSTLSQQKHPHLHAFLRGKEVPIELQLSHNIHHTLHNKEIDTSKLYIIFQEFQNAASTLMQHTIGKYR